MQVSQLRCVWTKSWKQGKCCPTHNSAEKFVQWSAKHQRIYPQMTLSTFISPPKSAFAPFQFLLERHRRLRGNKVKQEWRQCRGSLRAQRLQLMILIQMPFLFPSILSSIGGVRSGQKVGNKKIKNDFDIAKCASHPVAMQVSQLRCDWWGATMSNRNGDNTGEVSGHKAYNSWLSSKCRFCFQTFCRAVRRKLLAVWSDCEVFLLTVFYMECEGDGACNIDACGCCFLQWFPIEYGVFIFSRRFRDDDIAHSHSCLTHKLQCQQSQSVLRTL